VCHGLQVIVTVNNRLQLVEQLEEENYDSLDVFTFIGVSTRWQSLCVCKDSAEQRQSPHRVCRPAVRI
jgi:hypothetical protein